MIWDQRTIQLVLHKHVCKGFLVLVFLDSQPYAPCSKWFLRKEEWLHITSVTWFVLECVALDQVLMWKQIREEIVLQSPSTVLIHTGASFFTKIKNKKNCTVSWVEFRLQQISACVGWSVAVFDLLLMLEQNCNLQKLLPFQIFTSISRFPHNHFSILNLGGILLIVPELYSKGVLVPSMIRRYFSITRGMHGSKKQQTLVPDCTLNLLAQIVCNLVIFSRSSHDFPSILMFEFPPAYFGLHYRNCYPVVPRDHLKSNYLFIHLLWILFDPHSMQWVCKLNFEGSHSL